MNGDEDNFIYEETDIENKIEGENEKEKENERRTQRYRKQPTPKRLVNNIETDYIIDSHRVFEIIYN